MDNLTESLYGFVSPRGFDICDHSQVKMKTEKLNSVTLFTTKKGTLYFLSSRQAEKRGRFMSSRKYLKVLIPTHKGEHDLPFGPSSPPLFETVLCTGNVCYYN